ncbi:MAG: metallophosphoesterase [Novosphingobium sp.]|nr:metallophosphoesterase [Novosphingobium sp.]
MNKKILATFSTDWHIKDDNAEQIIDLVTQQCELNKKLKCSYIICLGDVFNSRKSQTLLVLNTFGKILDIIESYEMYLWCIPGNHDKTSYESEESFLDQFRYHPCFKLINKAGGLPFKDEKVFLHFLPFFSNELWLEKYEQLIDYVGEFEDNDKHILCSHIAVQGSRNNDGTKVESSIKPSMFKHFYKIFLGHYHNQQQIGGNVFHLPSIQQNNFGENEDKGFTVLYEDGSHELIPSKFKKFVKVKIDLSETSVEELNEYINEYQKDTENSYIRFVISGEEEVLKGINKDKFLQAGIDIKMKNNDIDVVEEFDSVEINKYTEESIIEEFKEFCEDRSLNFEKGLKYLR